MPQDLFQIDGLVHQTFWHGDSTLDQVFIGSYPRGCRSEGCVTVWLYAATTDVIFGQAHRLLKIGLARVEGLLVVTLCSVTDISFSPVY